MADGQGIDQLCGKLEKELERERDSNKKFKVFGGITVGVIFLYLLFLTVQFGKLLDPEGLALAAKGFAIDAVPTARAHLHEVLVDSAPDLASAASDTVVNMVPAYRGAIEDELSPVVDEVCSVLASVAVDKMVASLGDGANNQLAKQRALQSAASEVMARMDTLLNEAMDEPMELDGPSPRFLIGQALEQLVVVDKGLKRLARRPGTPEYELIMGWLNVFAQIQDEQEAAAVAAYESGEWK